MGLDAQRDTDGGSRLLDLVEHQTDLRPDPAHGHEDGFIIGAHQEDRAIVAFDVHLRQVSPAQTLSCPLTERQQGADMAATRSSSMPVGSAEAIGRPSNDTTEAASTSGTWRSSALRIESS